mmetsp:Transcript_62175/g.148320  ORF Transcript_62175/g.148320 Transcript_62175/m.148320 type:complete len:524 (-) Transcript_62175:91-1662(-)
MESPSSYAADVLEAMGFSSRRSCMSGIFRDDFFNGVMLSGMGEGQGQVSSEDLHIDKIRHLRVCEKNGLALEFVPAYLQGDRDVVMAAVMQNGGALQYAASKLLEDKEIVLQALTSNALAFEFVPAHLQRERDVLCTALLSDVDGMILAYLEESCRRDADIVLTALQSCPTALEHASEHLRDDEKVVVKAVQLDGMALRHASRRLCSDRNVVLAAVKSKGAALQYASESLQADREVVLCALAQDGCALEFVDRSLLSDRIVVLTAINCDVGALAWADTDNLTHEDLEYFASHVTDGYIFKVSAAITGRCCVIHCKADEMAASLYLQSCSRLRPGRDFNDHVKLFHAKREELHDDVEERVRDRLESMVTDPKWMSDNKPGIKHVLMPGSLVSLDRPVRRWPGVARSQVNYLVLKVAFCDIRGGSRAGGSDYSHCGMEPLPSVPSSERAASTVKYEEVDWTAGPPTNSYSSSSAAGDGDPTSSFSTVAAVWASGPPTTYASRDPTNTYSTAGTGQLRPWTGPVSL